MKANKIVSRMSKKTLRKKANLSKKASVGISIVVGRTDNDDTATIDLPSYDVEDEIMDKLFAGDEDEYDYDLVYIVSSEGFDLDEYDINDLNELVETYDSLDSYEQDIVDALVDNKDCDFDEAVNMIDSGDYFVISGTSYSDVGYNYVDEVLGSVSELGQDTLEQYFDYESFGRDMLSDYTTYEVNGDTLFVS